jgi:hypothetical protein
MGVSARLRRKPRLVQVPGRPLPGAGPAYVLSLGSSSIVPHRRPASQARQSSRLSPSGHMTVVRFPMLGRGGPIMKPSDKFRRFAACPISRSPRKANLPGTEWQQDGLYSLNWRKIVIQRRSIRNHAGADAEGTTARERLSRSAARLVRQHRDRLALVDRPVR